MGMWHRPPPGATDCFKALRTAFMKIIAEHGVVQEFLARVALCEQAHKAGNKAPGHSFLSNEALLAFRREASAFCQATGRAGDLAVDDGQPYLLNLEADLASIARDPDKTLSLHLAQGVPTGAIYPIQSSGMFEDQLDTGSKDADSECFTICEGNWKSSDEDLEKTEHLVDLDISRGYAFEIPEGDTAEGIVAIAEALKVNSTLKSIRCAQDHRVSSRFRSVN